MKRLLIMVLALLAVPMLAFAEAEVGKPAPDFSAVDTNGQPFKLADAKGSIVVLEWSNHECPFVHKYHVKGDMQGLQAKYTAKGVQWVRVLSSAPGKQGHVSDAQANAIIAKEGIKATHTLRDESGSIGHLYGAKSTPHMFVIDKEGVVAYAGAIDSIRSPRQEDIAAATPYVVNALDALLEGKPVEVSNTQPYGCGIKY